ncbi:MAG: hypothetical protein U0996_25245 [Planctomycetaceae bacterium]
MFRGLLLSALVLSLSALGVLAGRDITPGPKSPPFSRQLLQAETAQDTSPQFFPNTRDVNDFAADLARDPATLADEGNSGEFHDNSESVANTPSDIPSTEQGHEFGFTPSAPEGVSRDEACELIRREFPDAPDEVVQGWAESFESLSKIEVQGILQQKKLLSPSLDSLLPSSLLSAEAPKDAIIETGFTRNVPQEPTGSNGETSVAENGGTPGYRRRRELHFPGGPDASSTNQLLTDFTPGPLMVTGCRQHAAIQDTTGLSMFRLENNFATRCGAFQVLTDRRVGIKLAGKEFPAAGVSPVPEGFTSIAFDATGVVLARKDNGEVQALGRIELIRLNDTRAITTADNITFDYSAMAASDYEVITEAVVFPGKLELSNEPE